MRLRGTLFTMLMGAATAACGAVEAPPADDDDDTEVDAGTDPGDPDAAPDDGVALASSTPAADATTIDVVSNLTLTFTGALDAASVPGSITVYERASKRTIPLRSTTYDDATQTITVVFARPMNYMTQYRVEVDGLTAGGEPVAVETFRYRTYVNQYQRARSYNAAGAPTSRTDYTLDAEGFLDRFYNYTAGPDTLYDTADDVVSGLYDYSYNDDGTFAGYSFYSGAGLDAQWGTSDDVLGWYGEYQYGQTTAGHHRVIVWNAPGPDMQWHTADDPMSYWQTYVYDNQDRQVRLISYSGLGPDGLPYTSDDVPSFVNDTTYPSPTSTELVSYSGPGPDATWLTADDVVSYKHVNTLDTNGNYIAWRYLSPAGLVTQHQIYRLDPSGLPTRIERYTATGPDNQWFTSDDVITQYYEYAYDAQHRRTRYAQKDLGPNGIGPDGDDRDQYASFMYDPNH